ncbi:MAG: hypothetical protein GY822_18655 [Deltaproteobacteria bacterium]|nr:hypothetical protein [Deltaproteobacteria bacterium]
MANSTLDDYWALFRFCWQQQYNSLAKANGREENVVGWYHSHPGYGKSEKGR